MKEIGKMADSTRIAELEAQIESMKCCENCGNAKYDGLDYDCKVNSRCTRGHFIDWKPKGGINNCHIIKTG